MITLAIFFAVSFIAAAINSVAGGGTFLTFPVFILGGLTSIEANIMSTMALWPGTLASVVAYRGELTIDKKALIPLLLAGVAGGACGATLLLLTPPLLFNQLVPWLLLVATLIFTLGRRAIVFFNRGAVPKARPLLAIFLQIVIAIYGGYFGAGIGILTLAMLQLLGHSHIHQMNALKTVLTASINAITALIFACSGKVIWSLTAVMVAGALCGGYMGARLALKIAPHKIRWLVSIIGFSMTFYFFIHGV